MTHPTQEAGLLPCPFCGGKPHAMKPTASCGQDDVWCVSCGGNAESIEKWNTRAAPSPEPMQADLRETIPQDAVDAGVSAWHDAGGLLDDRCRAGLHAALAAMQAKSAPVAWQIRPHGTSEHHWRAMDGIAGDISATHEVRPLFAHPSPSAPNPDLAGLVERLQGEPLHRADGEWIAGLCIIDDKTLEEARNAIRLLASLK